MRENFPTPVMRIPPHRAMHKDLFGTKIRAALAALPSNATALQCLDQLRKQFPKELARQAAALHDLRQRCKPRIGLDLLPYLRSPSASQVTPPGLARARAERIARMQPGSHIWDCTCGLGMEAVHLVRAGLRVSASDHDPVTARFAEANLAHHGAPGRVFCADALRQPIRADGVLIDPDRRPQGQRTLDPDRWSPSLEASLQLAQAFPAAVLKLPPVWNVPQAWYAKHDLEFVSLGGQLVESTLWLGQWAEHPGAQAVRIDGARVSRFGGTPQTLEPLSFEQALASPFLFDPDPSLAAARLLESFAQAHGMAPMAPRLGYLGGHAPVRSPFGDCFAVLGHSPLRPKSVRAMLADHGIGPVQIRMRGHQERPEVLAKRLRGPGDRPGHLAIARLDGARRVFLVEPVNDSGQD